MSGTSEQAARRNRVVNRVSVMGQVSALVALASTGVTAGVLAHDAQVKDLAVAQARTAAALPPAAPVRLVPRPIRTVLVRLPAPVRRAAETTKTTVVRRRTVAQRHVVRPAPAPAQVSRPVPRKATKPAATTSTGS